MLCPGMADCEMTYEKKELCLQMRQDLDRESFLVFEVVRNEFRMTVVRDNTDKVS